MRGTHASPHKVALLLAVLELIETGDISDNRIYFDDQLCDAFSRQFAILASDGDRDRPFLPFFHLRSSDFWHHKIREDAQEAYMRLTTVKGSRQLNEVVSFAYLDDELFEILQFSVSRAMLRDSLMRNLDSSEVSEQLKTSGWDWLECELIVADYFEMLSLELRGQPYSKSDHRNIMLKKLKSRTSGSIEFKHQNISAVLVELGEPYIEGYKPRFNYQAQLGSVVRAHLAARSSSFDVDTSALADQIPIESQFDWTEALDTEAPERAGLARTAIRGFRARKVNFLEKEARNRKLGERGEHFAVEFERQRLSALLRGDLAERVELRSQAEGDGLGYDIRSFDVENGCERFIEVKTTNCGKYTPFFISANELAFSRNNAEQYSLYRIFSFRNRPRLFTLNGSVDQHVNLDSTTYRAGFG